MNSCQVNRNDQVSEAIHAIESARKASEGYECPKAFDGYGSQSSNQHPFYRTTSKEYGWYVPGYHTISSVYFPMQQKFSNHLAAAGMYRNHSLNTVMDPPPYN